MAKKLPHSFTDEDDLTRRAFAAYFRSAAAGETCDQPSNSSGVEEYSGKLYVHLHNGKGTLAVYRVRNDGVLKRLKRPPSDITWHR